MQRCRPSYYTIPRRGHHPQIKMYTQDFIYLGLYTKQTLLRRQSEYNPLLKKKIVDNILRVSNEASLTAIYKYSNTPVKALCPNTKRCALGMVGMCRSQNCTRSHTIPTDEEATHIVNLLEKAIKNSHEIKPAGK